MRKNQVVMAGLLTLIALSIAITSCRRGARVGDLQTRSQMIELGNASSVNVEIKMGAGELDVSGGASDLLEASFVYNVAELEPQATYSDGRLEISDKGVETGLRSLFDLDEFRNEWDLKFAEDVPMDLTIDLGAGRSDLALGSLALTGLDIRGGAGEVDLDLSGSQSLGRFDFDLGAGGVTIDLSGEWQHNLDARIAGGLGELSVRLPADVGVRIDVDAGLGHINASGLTRDGDMYTNDVYETSDVALRIDLSGGVGQINLDVE